MNQENKIMAILNEPSFELSKSTIADFSRNIISDAEEKDIISQLIHCDFIMNIFKQSSVGLRHLVLDELDKYPNTECIFKGVKLKQKETGVKYDYSNNDIWVQLNEKMTKLKAEMKEIEQTIRSVTRKRSMINEETGEIYDLVPPIKTSTTSVEVTFPKDADISKTIINQ